MISVLPASLSNLVSNVTFQFSPQSKKLFCQSWFIRRFRLIRLSLNSATPSHRVHDHDGIDGPLTVDDR